MRISKLLIAAAMVLCASSYGAKADLLTSAYEAQLVDWLGEGPLALTKVFTKVAGDGKTSSEFHAVVDGIGRTFTIIKVTNAPNGPAEQIIGGYNPQRWDSHGHFHVTLDNSERTAFIFNLSTTELRRQALAPGAPNDYGQDQTYNFASRGPTFGRGFDILVGGGLESGYVEDFSYGANALGGSNVLGQQYVYNLTYGVIEVYTIAPVPAGLTVNSWRLWCAARDTGISGSRVVTDVTVRNPFTDTHTPTHGESFNITDHDFAWDAAAGAFNWQFDHQRAGTSGSFAESYCSSINFTVTDVDMLYDLSGAYSMTSDQAILGEVSLWDVTANNWVFNWWQMSYSRLNESFVVGQHGGQMDILIGSPSGTLLQGTSTNSNTTSSSLPTASPILARPPWAICTSTFRWTRTVTGSAMTSRSRPAQTR